MKGNRPRKQHAHRASVERRAARRRQHQAAEAHHHHVRMNRRHSPEYREARQIRKEVLQFGMPEEVKAPPLRIGDWLGKRKAG